MHALRELAHEHDARRVAETRSNPVVTLPAGAAGRFAELVRDRMEGPVLRYSHRTRLIREAQQRGIGRFEANLVIAAVQHQVETTREVQPVASQRSWLPPMVGFFATQCAIVSGVWWLVG